MKGERGEGAFLNKRNQSISISRSHFWPQQNVTDSRSNIWTIWTQKVPKIRSILNLMKMLDEKGMNENTYFAVQMYLHSVLDGDIYFWIDLFVHCWLLYFFCTLERWPRKVNQLVTGKRKCLRKSRSILKENKSNLSNSTFPGWPCLPPPSWKISLLRIFFHGRSRSMANKELLNNSCAKNSTVLHANNHAIP